MAWLLQIRRHIGVGVALLCACLPSPALAQPSEQAVKAAFLPKFARYVTWPDHARPTGNDPLALCLIGNGSFGTLVERAARGQTVGQRPIAVRRISSPANAAGCHLAFVNGGSARDTAAIVDMLQKWPILTVTDSRHGPARGMVHFAVHEGRVRFYIDDAMAARSGLHLDSRLLSIALGVKQRRL